jgi:hypothetical protein
VWAGDGAQCLPGVQSPALHKAGVVVQDCATSTQETEAGGSEVQSHLWLSNPRLCETLSQNRSKEDNSI